LTKPTIHMGFTSAQGHSGLTALGPGLWPAYASRRSQRAQARSRHAWPWPERALWQAHRRLNDDGHLEQIKGKQSLGIDLHAATRKPRRGGWEGGAHWRRHFYGGVRVDEEEASEGPKEWSRLPEKWSGRTSLAARNSLQGWRGWGTIGGGCCQRGACGGRRRRGNPVARLR
jgi:hypothetical protein